MLKEYRRIINNLIRPRLSETKIIQIKPKIKEN